MNKLAFVLILISFPAFAQDTSGKYNDSATKQWFQDLKIPGTRNGCCDQADCHQTPAIYVNGFWLAESKYGINEWLPIPLSRVESQPSIFVEAVVCENENNAGGDNVKMKTVRPDGTQTTRDVWVYCFSPPPNFS